MSGSEELAQAEEEQVEGGEEYEGNEDDQELAAMQKELEKAEQQKEMRDHCESLESQLVEAKKHAEAQEVTHVFFVCLPVVVVCSSTTCSHSSRLPPCSITTSCKVSSKRRISSVQK